MCARAPIQSSRQWPAMRNCAKRCKLTVNLTKTLRRLRFLPFFALWRAPSRALGSGLPCAAVRETLQTSRKHCAGHGFGRFLRCGRLPAELSPVACRAQPCAKGSKPHENTHCAGHGFCRFSPFWRLAAAPEKVKPRGRPCKCARPTSKKLQKHCAGHAFCDFWTVLGRLGPS